PRPVPGAPRRERHRAWRDGRGRSSFRALRIISRAVATDRCFYDQGPIARPGRLPILTLVLDTCRPMAGSPVVGIVDDDASLLRALRRLLQAVGFTVETFGSGEEFLRSVRPPPSCLVLDIHLGTFTGFDLHESLLASGASVPTVLITGHDDDTPRERARRAGAVAYLCKPFDDQSLISAVERALAQH